MIFYTLLWNDGEGSWRIGVDGGGVLVEERGRLILFINKEFVWSDLIIISEMLSSTDSTQQSGLKAGDVFDPVSKNIFSFVDGSLQVKCVEKGVISQHRFPNLL